jgi:hypothetical protein
MYPETSRHGPRSVFDRSPHGEFTRSRVLRPLLVSAVLGLSMTPLLAGSAFADDAASVVDQTAEAMAIEGAAPAAPNPDVTLPAAGTGLAALELPGGGALTLDLPATGSADKEGLTTVFNGTAPDTQVAVQPTAEGLRALITIDSPTAPERFPFPVGGDVAQLVSQDDGSVLALDADGVIVTTLTPPWARDADGKDVPTHYELDGTTVVQVVNHHSGTYAYGITADPWFVVWFVVRYTVPIAINRCWAHPFCRSIIIGSVGAGIDWARRHL